MEKINPEKYIELAAKVQQEAKEAAIALLRDKVEGHCIDPDFSTLTGGTTIRPAIGYSVLKAMMNIFSFMHMAWMKKESFVSRHGMLIVMLNTKMDSGASLKVISSATSIISSTK